MMALQLFTLNLLALIMACNSMQTSTGILRYQEGKYFEAIPELEKALVANPEDVEAKFFLGLCYSQLGEYSKAYSYFRPIADSTHKRAVHAAQNIDANFASTYNQGVRYAQAEDYTNAITWFGKAISANPKEPAGYIQSARSRILHGDRTYSSGSGRYLESMEDARAMLENASRLNTTEDEKHDISSMLSFLDMAEGKVSDIDTEHGRREIKKLTF